MMNWRTESSKGAAILLVLHQKHSKKYTEALRKL